MSEEEQIHSYLKDVVGNDNFDVDSKEAEMLSLPPIPHPFKKWSEHEEKFKYTGSVDDYNSRIHHKLYSMWIIWALLRTNEKIEKLCSQESDKESDEFFLKATIVDIMDVIAKVLINTDLIDELAYLVMTEEEFKQRRLNHETRKKLMEEKQQEDEKKKDEEKKDEEKPKRTRRKKSSD